jgi:hypothetical protein
MVPTATAILATRSRRVSTGVSYTRLCMYPHKKIQWSQVRGARGPGYWFQHDGAPAHCIDVVREYLFG